jgi:hypothetical protein
MIETEAQRVERAWLQNEADEGMVEGYESNLNELPAFYYEQTLYKLTARQRGFFFGRELRIHDLEATKGVDL